MTAIVALHRPEDRPLAEWLTAPKKAFVSGDTELLTVRQVGAFGLGRIELPACDDPALAETRIETFVVDLATRSVEPVGEDHELIEAFAPAVAELVEVVGTALDAESIATEPDAFLTVAFTPRSQIAGEPHMDDADFAPEAGPGLVAVVGSHRGARVCCDDLAADARAGLPLALDDKAVASFVAGRLNHQRVEAGEIVLMPQFGQLHAGPDLRDEPGPPRALMVLRAQVVPRAH